MTIKDGHALKALQGRLEKEKAELLSLNKQIGALQSEAARRNKNIKKLKKEIGEFTTDEIIITEHAILRYLTRVELIPIEQVKDRVITDALKQQVGVLGGNGSFPLGDTGHSVILKNNQIITIE